MSECRFSPQARLDLLEIRRHIARDNPAAAKRLVDRLENRGRLLAQNPNIGQSCSELFPGLRCFSLGNYLLFFRPIPEGVYVMRVLHGARDIESLFRDFESPG